MSTASGSPAIAGAGAASLFLFVFGALLLFVTIVGAFSVTSPQLALSPLRIAVSGLALFGGGLFGTFVCLLSIAR